MIDLHLLCAGYFDFLDDARFGIHGNVYLVAA